MENPEMAEAVRMLAQEKGISVETLLQVLAEMQRGTLQPG